MVYSQGSIVRWFRHAPSFSCDQIHVLICLPALLPLIVYVAGRYPHEVKVEVRWGDMVRTLSLWPMLQPQAYLSLCDYCIGMGSRVLNVGLKPLCTVQNIVNRRNPHSFSPRACPQPPNLHHVAQDALGHVNNAAYFVYFEQIRTSLFGDIHCTDEDGVTPINMILAETTCRYRR